MKKLIASAFLVFGLATAGFSATITPFLSHASAAQAFPPYPGPNGGA